MEAIGEDRDRKVVMYCGSGKRVGRAISALEEEGYTGLFNATGLDALQATRPSDG
jgi:rhodanese-related sulfurtransferase